MRRTLIIIVIVLAFFPSMNGAQGQSITGGITIGLGSYSMTTLKTLQDYRLQYSGLPGQVTDNFPSHWNSGFEFGLCFPRFPSRLTWFFQFNSTGGRVSSVDYSGEMKLDVIANCEQYGISMEQDVISYKFFTLSVSGKLSYLHSAVKTLDYLRINDQEQQQEDRFVSKGAGLEPGIIAGFHVFFFRVGIYGGYLFSFSEGLHLQGNSKAVIKLPNEDDIPAEWNGWRAGLKIDFYIPIKKKAAEKPAG
jgi:hypothetical protein